MDGNSDTAEEIQTVALIDELARMLGRPCEECAAALCAHELLMSVVVGYRGSPRCLSCLSRQLRESREELRDRLYHYIMRRACRRAAWLWASREEKDTAVPSCLWPKAGKELESQWEAPLSELPGPTPIPDAEWDAGNMGCGELVMALRLRLQVMKPRQILKLTATDNGAPEDLPAWCRLAGHELMSSRPPEYWIKRKEK